MRKLAFLMACLMLLTVGGVYAAWLYTDTNSDVIDRHAEVVVTLTGATTTGAAGTFSVETNLVMTIDQSPIREENGKLVNDHKTVLKYATTEGSEDLNNIYLTVTFTPSENASQEIKANGIDAEVYLKTTTEMKYEGTSIFDFGSHASNGTFEANVLNLSSAATGTKWEKNDGVFTITYTGAQLAEMIQLSQTFVLDTKTEYDAFEDALNGNVGVYVTDGIINGTENQG